MQMARRLPRCGVGAGPLRVRLVNHIDVAGNFFGEEGGREEDDHDDDRENGQQAGPPAGV